jgi:hypothetical protein
MRVEATLIGRLRPQHTGQADERQQERTRDGHRLGAELQQAEQLHARRPGAVVAEEFDQHAAIRGAPQRGQARGVRDR